MVEPVAAWWARRQFSRDVEVPYPVGTYRDAWAPYPALIRQYHPEFNDGITLTQIPPAAEVLLLWQCDVGHLFAATPAEQRQRPGASAADGPRGARNARRWRSRGPRVRRRRSGRELHPPRGGWGVCSARRRPSFRSVTHSPAIARRRPLRRWKRRLRQKLEAVLEFTTGVNAVRVGRPFFDHVEVWPDIVIPELRIAVEYDSPGRHGLEHVGRREQIDRRKDRVAAGRPLGGGADPHRQAREARSARPAGRRHRPAHDDRVARCVPRDSRRSDRRGVPPLATRRAIASLSQRA